jgi:hypothetical protein
MVYPLDRKVLELATREQGELLVLNKIDEMIREQNRLEQIIQFISGIANEESDKPNDVQ